MAEQTEDRHFPHFATVAIHAGQHPDRWASKAVVPPITLSTTFKQDELGKPQLYAYSRVGNPTRDVFEECIAAMEGAKYAIATSSGLAAQSVIVQMLKSGDHIICMNDIYAATYRYFRWILSNFGITTTLVDLTDQQAFKDALQESTKIVWLETPSNPLLHVVDIKATVELVRKIRGDIIIVVDNTFMSPYFQRPLDFGCDVVYHSVTKYLNGHSDVIMGVVCTNSEELSKKMTFIQLAGGSIPSPFDCYMANRGLKTLHIRMKEHQKNAMAVSRFLQSSPHVTEVIYPGLPSHPQHELMKRQCKGFGGMVSFRIKGNLESSRKFLQATKVFVLAESLGGYESLAELPYLMTHASIPVEEREKVGVTDTVIRLSVGLEDKEDLIEDLQQALEVSQN